MDKTPNNDLLEQWRKEAEEYANIGNKKWSLDHNASMNNYIAGCKATHEKMVNEVERLKMHLEYYYKDGMRQFLQDRELDEDIEPAITRSWNNFKKNNNIL